MYNFGTCGNRISTTFWFATIPSLDLAFCALVLPFITWLSGRLPCVAMCYSVLQCEFVVPVVLRCLHFAFGTSGCLLCCPVACSVIQCVIVWCSWNLLLQWCCCVFKSLCVLRCCPFTRDCPVACHVLQCVTVCYSVLQCELVVSVILQCLHLVFCASKLQFMLYCRVQRVAVCNSALQWQCVVSVVLQCLHLTLCALLLTLFKLLSGRLP